MNLAMRKPTEQSSTRVWSSGVNGSSDKAVDGCKTTDFSELCCTHTREEAQPWWGVDLEATYVVILVRTLNRGDVCCGKTLYFSIIRNFTTMTTLQVCIYMCCGFALRKSQSFVYRFSGIWSVYV